MDPNLNLPNILVSFESSIKSKIRENNKILNNLDNCPKMRVSKDLVDKLNLFMNRFVKQVMSSAILIAQYKKVKTITENELRLVFHTMFNPKAYEFTNVRLRRAKDNYKQNFLDNPNPKKPATLKNKYCWQQKIWPSVIEELNPYQLAKAMRLLLPKGYRINELAIVHLTSTLEYILNNGLWGCMREVCKLLKDKNYKGSRMVTYDRLKEAYNKMYDYFEKYPEVRFYNISNVCKLLP